MNVCVFSPDVEPLLDGGWRAGLGVPSETADVRLITNSWAERPVGSNIYATGGAARTPMKIARRVMGRSAGRVSRLTAAAAAPFASAVRRELLEGIRGADPDVIVSVHPGWTTLLRRQIRAAGERWPCVSLGQPLPAPAAPWRRYDRQATVTIVLPTYNGVRYLGESIQSCLSQTHTNLELIVVDDGSTAPVGDVVSTFTDRRLTYVRLTKNGGLPRALNEGFARATGSYCTWTSDDNFYAPDAIERLLAFLQTYPSIDFVYAESYRRHEQDDREPWDEDVIRPRPPESLARDNYIGACFLYTRHVARTIGEYNAGAVLAEDYDYWVRINKRFTMQRLFAPLYTYRFHRESLTSKHGEDIARTVKAVQHAHGVGARV
jgi:hypothetical protein